MTLGYGDLKKGITIELDGTPYLVVDYEQRKMQKRAPVLRVRLKDIKTGRVIEKAFQGFDVKLVPANVERRNAQYIYDEGELFYFMDNETYEQFALTREQLTDTLKFIKPELNVDVLFFEGTAVTVDLPNNVNLKVTEAPPAVKGDTAQGGTKPITLETGLTIQVPLFINQGEIIRVDTRTGEYLSRA